MEAFKTRQHPGSQEWASQEHQLAAVIAGRIPADQVPAASWPTIIDLAVAHDLGAILAAVTESAETLEQAERERLRSVQRRAVLHAMLQNEARRHITQALEQAEIPALWLKGSALAYTSYPEPHLRPMLDLDVLVPYELRERAFEAVTQLGYHEPEDTNPLAYPRAVWLKGRHAYDLEGGPANQVALELHWWLLQAPNTLLSAAQLAWFWQHTRRVETPDVRLTVLNPEAHLLYLCAHAVLQHGLIDLKLIRYFDLHQLVTSGALDWDVIVENAAALKWTLAVERALSAACEYFETPVPAQVLRRLKQDRPSDEPVHLVTRLAGRGYRWEKMRRSLNRLSTREQLQIVWKTVFPPAAYVRRRYHVAPDVPVWPYYVCRWMHQGQAVWWALRTHESRWVSFCGTRPRELPEAKKRVDE